MKLLLSTRHKVAATSRSTSALDEQVIERRENLLPLLVDLTFDESVKQAVQQTVQPVAEELHVSAHYLSDMLRTLTGQSTQQHIHHKLIEKAKELITTTSLSMGEIAYQLGFEHSQSFNKLFKQKTNQTPLFFRRSLN